jgi:two-component system, cell cycle sensor histidine kinase and response regulator CckA
LTRRSAQELEMVLRLAAGMAHDLNNLLTAVVGFATVLGEELAEDDPSREGLSGILGAAKRAAGLGRTLLATLDVDEKLDPKA